MENLEPQEPQAGMSFNHVAVIGAGLMGHGIAQVFAEAGLTVHVYDNSADNLEQLHQRVAKNLSSMGRGQDCLTRIHACSTMAAAATKADIVFEAVAEDLALKQKIFAELENYTRTDTVFASNTSVIPITGIMQGLQHKNRALGTHWWNPPFLIPLVEVVPTQWTDPAIADQVMGLLTRAGKEPVRLAKDVAGFIGNRLQGALWREAISVVAEGICSAEDVDRVVKASFGRRLAVLGPLENADLIGTDLTLAIQRIILPEINASPAPTPYLEDLVKSGRLGMKTGEGFRRWTADEQTALRTKFFDELVRQLNAPQTEADNSL